MRDKGNPPGPAPSKHAREFAIGELARRQHGVIATRQLRTVGLNRDAILRRVRAGRLYPLHTGVYAVGHTHLTQHGRWMAAVLSCPEGAVLSHRSAAALWGLTVVPAARIDVMVSGRRGNGRRKGRSGIAIHRPRTLHDRDRTRRFGIPTTTPSRTLLDLAGVVSPAQLKHAFGEAERLGRLDRARLAQLGMSGSGRRGTGTLRSLLSARPLPFTETRSRLEQRFLRFCRDRGLPIPAVNVPVDGYEVDCLWPKQRVVVELDSWAHHGDRSSFEADRRRDARIQIGGHRIVRVTSRRLSKDPDRLEAELRNLLGLPAG